jgi:predicted TIM-barrel enzyme
VLEKVKNAIPDTAVFANTGCKAETIERILKIADGAVVGTTFKTDGDFNMFVEKDRVARFMDIVRKARS